MSRIDLHYLRVLLSNGNYRTVAAIASITGGWLAMRKEL